MALFFFDVLFEDRKVEGVDLGALFGRGLVVGEVLLLLLLLALVPGGFFGETIAGVVGVGLGWDGVMFLQVVVSGEKTEQGVLHAALVAAEEDEAVGGVGTEAAGEEVGGRERGFRVQGSGFRGRGCWIAYCRLPIAQWSRGWGSGVGGPGHRSCLVIAVDLLELFGEEVGLGFGEAAETLDEVCDLVEEILLHDGNGMEL